jgi:pre-mRNA-processing factor 19
VYHVKTWQLLKQLGDHTAGVTGVAFGADAKYLASSSMDRSMKVFGAATGSAME